jgi:hypothetical protein
MTAGKSRIREVGLLLINRKGSAKTSLSYAEAVEGALFLGWLEASQTNSVIKVFTELVRSSSPPHCFPV